MPLLFRALPVLLLFVWGCQKPAQPQFSIPESYPSAEAYAEKRAALAAQNASNDPRNSIVLSPEEKALDKRMKSFRAKLIEKTKAETNFYPPARYFYKSKDYMLQDELFHLFREMPKGGILHIHTGATGSMWWVVDRALRDENCYFFTEKDHEKTPYGALRYFQDGEAPEGYVKTQELAKTKPNFRQELYSLLTFDERVDADSFPIWPEFETRFSRVGGLINYVGNFTDYYEAAMDTLIADGLQHVEIRAWMAGGLYDPARPEVQFGMDEKVKAFKKALENVQKKHPKFTCRIIFTFLRFFEEDAVARQLVNAYKAQKNYPELISGYDLVAEEDAGHKTRYFLNTWLKADSLAKEYGFKVQYYFHDGESNWADEDNLMDAVLLGSRRLGHAYNLFRFPALKPIIRQQGICIEVCPLSNQILGYVRDLRNHPAAQYIREGIPCTLSPDDPGIFDYNGVSPDFWAAYLAWDLDLRDVKWLIQNSLKYSTLPEAEKEKALKVWEADWKAFVEKAIKN